MNGAGAFQRIDVQPRIRQTGDGLGRIVGAQCDHQGIGGEQLPVDLDFPACRIDAGDIATAQFHAAIRQPVKRAGEVFRFAVADHQP